MTRSRFLPPVRLRMPSLFRKQHLVGARPGTLAVSDTAPKPRIRVIHYDKSEVVDKLITDLSELDAIPIDIGVTWIDVQGLGDESVLRAIADRFQIGLLALEDMVNVPQRPQIVAHGDSLLWVSRMARIDAGLIDREQISIHHSDRVLVTFQERAGDVLDPVRARIHDGLGPMRDSGADYLAYAILDTVVDGYYPVVERINVAMEEIETQVMHSPSPDHLAAINHTKLLSTTLNRSMKAKQEALHRFIDDPTEHVSEKTLPFFRDVLDHTNQLVDVIDNQREHLNGLLNTYLSMVGYRANEVMKVLTIMASIFIPLTFIAGVYGMNFQFMPELAYRWAYPAALGLMAIVAIGMTLFFVRRGWLGSGRLKRPVAKLSTDDHEPPP